jgi:hypothetical protein
LVHIPYIFVSSIQYRRKFFSAGQIADGFSLASEQKIVYFPFYQKKTTLFLMGGKDCLSLGLSLDPAISNLKEKFFIF